MIEIFEQPVFIDTNIWLYGFIKEQNIKKHNIAREIITTHKNIFINVQVINEITVNLIKKTPIDELSIRKLISSFYKRYKVINFSKNILTKSSLLREKLSLSFWDSLIVASALYAKANILITEDMQNGLIIENHLKIVNPFIEL